MIGSGMSWEADAQSVGADTLGVRGCVCARFVCEPVFPQMLDIDVMCPGKHARSIGGDTTCVGVHVCVHARVFLRASSLFF